MIVATTATLGQAPFWYVTRSTGIVAFVLLTLSITLGIASTQRMLASPAWPRFATQNLHRNVALLGLAFVVVHIVTTILDGYVSVSWWAVIVPGVSHYRTLWVALGTIAFDLTLIVTATSLLRLRMAARLWRQVHYSVYLMWPLSLLHFLKTGTDAGQNKFGVWIGIVGAAVVIGSVALRLHTRNAPPTPARSIR